MDKTTVAADSDSMICRPETEAMDLDSSVVALQHPSWALVSAEAPPATTAVEQPDAAVETSDLLGTDVGDSDLVTSNEDVALLLSALKVLHGQLAQAKSDITRLEELRAMVMTDPRKFTSDFLKKKLGSVPKAQRVFASPAVDLSKYLTSSRRRQVEINYPRPARTHLFRNTSHTEPSLTPSSGLDILDELADPLTQPSPMIARTQSQPLKPTLHSPSPKALSTTSHTLSTPKIATSSKLKNRRKDSSERTGIGRSGENYRLWTTEEQYQLKELIEKNPERPGLSGMMWFEFLSQEMGTRTKVQIHSYVRHNRFTIPMGTVNKVQKVSTPGRSSSPALRAFPPKKNDSTGYSSRGTASKERSTGSTANSDTSDLQTLAGGQQKAPTFAEEARMINLKDTKPVHRGYRCDLCEIEPIVGVRWKCKICLGDSQVDLCSDCIGIEYEAGAHTKDHTFEEIATAEVWAESSTFDYLGF
ncbi:hypothetical protein BASA61_003844 [Batrachochytrium salamandrivorans]|nr:hypothetical protein BASA62_001564 [Batrachochytrium salamandrivorans]KAH6595145.1 hypothetical protein BASA61_003844 [Batrachochytrium salamandrivorans]